MLALMVPEIIRGKDPPWTFNPYRTKGEWLILTLSGFFPDNSETDGDFSMKF